VFNTEFNEVLKKNPNIEQDVIKLQALFRGYLVRKRITGFPKPYNPNEGRVNYVENHKFPNGAIYTGTP